MNIQQTNGIFLNRGGYVCERVGTDMKRLKYMPKLQAGNLVELGLDLDFWKLFVRITKPNGEKRETSLRLSPELMKVSTSIMLSTVL